MAGAVDMAGAVGTTGAVGMAGAVGTAGSAGASSKQATGMSKRKARRRTKSGILIVVILGLDVDWLLYSAAMLLQSTPSGKRHRSPLAAVLTFNAILGVKAALDAG